MPIVSSTIVEDSPQRDGRRAVRERHVDHLGATYDFAFLAESGIAADAQLAGHAVQLEADLANAEIDTNAQRAINQQAPILNHSTAAQFRSRVRAMFQAARQWDVVRLGRFILDLNLSDAQLQSIFGVSAGAQLAALKAKLTALAAKYDDVVTQQGQ